MASLNISAPVKHWSFPQQTEPGSPESFSRVSMISFRTASRHTEERPRRYLHHKESSQPFRITQAVVLAVAAITAANFYYMATPNKFHSSQGRYDRNMTKGLNPNTFNTTMTTNATPNKRAQYC
jgi:hypothetical protein